MMISKPTTLSRYLLLNRLNQASSLTDQSPEQFYCTPLENAQQGENVTRETTRYEK